MNKIIRFPQVQEITGLSRPTIWRLERSGKFPKRRQLSPSSVGWLEAEINEWLESRPKVA